MSECCGATKGAEKQPAKYPCPSCNKEGLSVPFPTVLHHLKAPWETQTKEQGFYFCDAPDCATAYFGLEGSAISKQDLRTKMAVKGDADGLVCFCYGVSLVGAADPATKVFVMAQTKAKNCACDRRNPSGRCCLKYFPK